MLWVAAIALSIACITDGVIAWRRRRRVLGVLLIGVGLFLILAPLPTIEMKVELPAAVQH